MTAPAEAARVAPALEAGWFARWEHAWFGEASLVRLAVFRIVLLAAAFDGVWLVRKAVLQYSAGRDPIFLQRSWRPIYAFELLGIGAPGPEAVHVVWGVLVVALVLGILGLCTRVACTVVAVLAFYWIGTASSIGKPHHTCVALVFGLLALPFAPVGARLSLESAWRRLRAARRGDDPCAVPELGAWAAFPLLLTQLTVAMGYAFAGSTKLAKSGLEWINGYTLQGIMVEYHSSWTPYLSEHRELLVLMSIGLLVGQIGFPLVFLWRPARWFFLPVAVLFHVMAMQTMATGTFLTLWLTLVAFLELERVPAFLARTVGTGPAWRQLAAALFLGACAYGVAELYLEKKPAWLVLPLLPVAVALVLMSRPRLLPALELDFDPGSGRARRAVAWIGACDWAGRIRPRTSPGAASRVRDGGGRELGSTRGFLAVLARLPLGLLIAPVLWRFLRTPPNPPAR